MERTIDAQKAQALLENGFVEAEILLKDEDKLEKFLQRLEKRLKEIPIAGSVLSEVPVWISLVRSYTKKEYTTIPGGTIIAIISALLYFLSPIDVIPDVIPGVGIVDDIAVLTFCWKMIEADIDEYVEWRARNNKVLI